jgi:REP element-mobilizing transposase RayT
MTDYKDNRPHHLPRLRIVLTSTPLFFITTNTHLRSRILDNERAHSVLRAEWEAARERHGWLVGRYVVMPDHIHFFCAPLPGAPAKTLSMFVMRWKEWTSKRMKEVTTMGPVWEKGFFDHLLRSDESYREKCHYLRENPVVAGLVSGVDDWKWQGFVDFDEPG